jgi:hypothetical protein
VQKQKGHPAIHYHCALSWSSGGSSHNNNSYLLAVTLPGLCALFKKYREAQGAQNKQRAQQKKQINETSTSSTEQNRSSSATWDDKNKETRRGWGRKRK